MTSWYQCSTWTAHALRLSDWHNEILIKTVFSAYRFNRLVTLETQPLSESHPTVSTTLALLHHALMDSPNHQSNRPGDCPHDNTAANQPCETTNPPNNDGLSCQRRNTSSMLVPQPSDHQQIPGAAPGRAMSSILHDNPLPGGTSFSNQDHPLRNENVPSHTPNAPFSSAPLEPALRAAAEDAPEVEESPRQDSKQDDHIEMRHGCLLNRQDYTVKFAVHQLPALLAVRFLRRICNEDMHSYARLYRFNSAILKGVASQMTDYWPAGTDQLELVCGPFAIFFEGWQGKSTRNDECAHCIWLRVRGEQRIACNWQDWQNKLHVDACQQCVANGTFCMVPDYGKTSQEKLQTNVPIILPMPESSMNPDTLYPMVPNQIEYWVDKERHERYLHAKAWRDINGL